MVPPEAPDLTRGIELFNAGEYFESHEVLEAVWGPSRGEERLFLQALIHFAVGLYHRQQDNPIGTELQLRKALRKLGGYLPVYRGIDTARLYREGQTALTDCDSKIRIHRIREG
jgi:predicted metal-dependent hydrolase